MAKRGRKPTADRREAEQAVTEIIQAATGYMVPPIDGVVLDTPEKQALWAQFTSSRMPEDWPDKDLRILGEIVRLTAAIDQIIDAATSPFGIIDVNSAGTKVLSAELLAADKMLNMRNALCRMINLYVARRSQDVQGAAGKVLQGQRAQMAAGISADDDDDSLLAT